MTGTHLNTSAEALRVPATAKTTSTASRCGDQQHKPPLPISCNRVGVEGVGGGRGRSHHRLLLRHKLAAGNRLE